MVRRKDSFWAYAEEIENGRFICKFCEQSFPGGISRIKSHLSGISGRDIQICLRVPKSIQLEAKQALLTIDPPTKRAKNVAASNDNFLEGEIISGSSSSHMTNLSKLDKQVAKFLISNGICLNAVRSPIFKDFVNGVVEHGPDYELPSHLTLKSQLIPDIKKEVGEYIKNVITCSSKTGYTLMSDKWNDEICIFVYTPIGVVCMGQSYDLNFEGIISSVMVFTKPANAVQFIIKGESFFDPIQNFVNNKYPSIPQIPCATRGIRLLLNKLRNLPFVANTLTVSKWMVSYFYKHKVNMRLRRVQNIKRIEFSGFFTLLSLLEVESELQALQTPIAALLGDWEKLLNNNDVAFKVANFIGYAVHCKEFWSRCRMVSQVMRPLFQALSLVHCDGPTSGYLYEMMERVQDAVKECCGSNQVLYDDIWKILKEARSNIIHQIHAAAAFLNPIYMSSKKFEENDEMTGGINYILEHLVQVEEKEAFMSQVQLYRMKDSNLFTTPALMMLETSHPRIWWESCGNHLPVLQKYAIQILSQPCSSTLCKRHDLRNGKFDNLAFMMNTLMMERYKSLNTKMTQPIILDKLGELYDDFISQDLLDEDNYFDEDSEWDETYDELEREIYDAAHETLDTVLDEMLQDSTGSWLDRWPQPGW